ncbi:flavin reductase [Nocardioides mesophilus]|uniref:Flavin reductase n=1 Tax=Nocardioides mesophilus TaxID=433659 RepID=A0A7G9RGC0_9ACTN|nr:flavin reductase [Nocardioides mesophilus]QNN54645.1 flavin reductase [Nocardioides mesophilus]
MSPSVAVVGAGPAGTTLALGLLGHGCQVTLVTDRTAEEIRDGAVMSSQVTFESALDLETTLGVTALLPAAPSVDRLSFDLRTADGATSAFDAPLSAPARSVDLRLKLPAVLEAVQRLGGKVVVRNAGIEDVEELAARHDLVVISTGRGGLADLFEVDAERTPYSSPRRVAALTYLRGVAADPAGPALRYHVVEGVGECFTCPALTVDGPCDVMVVEGVPGGPADVWEDVRTPGEHLDRLRTVLAEHFPAEAVRIAGAELVDDRAVLRGTFTPVVRRPVGTLPSGATVLGMADAVVLNDPVTSQGANTAVKSASFYLDAIVNHTGAFDEDWMGQTFDHFWRGWARFATRWTNDWLQPRAPHQLAVLAEAGRLPGVAERIAAGFDDARLFEPWWFDEAASAAFLAEQRAAAGNRFDARDLRRALGQYATGVTVVTATHRGERFAMTANSFTSVSLNPPLVLWAAAVSSPSLPAFEAADRFAVNVLAADQHHLSRQFSTSGSDKFDGVALAGDDPPLLEGTVATFVCRRTERVDAGDHVVFLGEIESYDAPGGEPLVFHSGAYRLAAKHPDL